MYNLVVILIFCFYSSITSELYHKSVCTIISTLVAVNTNFIKNQKAIVYINKNSNFS